MKKWVEEEGSRRLENELEFDCFATMLRMFLKFDSFISTRSPKATFRIRVTKKTQDALEPVFQCFLGIPFCVPRYFHTSPDPI
jgi:hypothetical protein